MALIGKIIAMTGVATAVSENGVVRTLAPGDQLEAGESIQTTAGVTVKVQLTNGRVVDVASDQTVALTSDITGVYPPTAEDSAVNLATLDDLDATINAVGNESDGPEPDGAIDIDPAGILQEGHDLVFLSRITEDLSPLAFSYPQPTAALDLTPLSAQIAPNIGLVTSDAENEGVDLVHTVEVNNGLGVPMTFPFSITFVTASADDIGAPVFSDGVTFDAATGLITVPAGVTSFTVTVPTVSDAVFEGNETYQINVGGVVATGTIVESAPTILSVEPGAPGVGDDAVPEGVDLVYTVTLSEETTGEFSYPFALGGGTASNDDIGAPVFSNGVQLVNGLVVIPAGVTSFTVTVPTVADNLVEGTTNETLPLTIGGVTGVGQIIDPTIDPTILSVEPGNPGIGDDAVLEGNDLIYTVTLSGETTAPVDFAFELGGGTAADSDIGGPTFSNGVTLVNGVITIPAGVTTFTVTVPTVQDALFEGDVNETVPLSIGGVAGTGQIIDDDVIVTEVGSGVTTNDPFAGPVTTGSTVTEGTPLLFTVTLNKAPSADSDVTLQFADQTATFGTDTTTPLQVSFDNGATFTNITGTTVTVPSGASSFIVSVPTVTGDGVETAETLLFTAATVSNTVADTPAQVTGTILDDDIIVTEVGSGVTTNDPFAGPVTTGSTVTEGTPLLFTVTLNKAPSADSDVTLQFADQTATFGTDTTTPLQVSFDNGATFTNITGTTVTVPSGASSFIVSVPTVTGDGVETAETLLFTAATVSNTVADTPAQVTGTILDDDIIVTEVGSGVTTNDPFAGPVTTGSTVTEGTPLLFTVTLNKAPSADSDVTLQFADQTATFGTDTTTPLQVSFDNGATFTNITGTTVTVPSGASSFIVSVPTVTGDGVETAETLLFTAATVSNTVADTPAQVTGTILDDDIIVTEVGSGVTTNDPFAGPVTTGSTVTEGTPLLFTVTLNKAPSADSDVTLQFADQTATFGTDTTTPLQVSFDNGATFTNITGTTVTVPSGASSFIVSVPTVTGDGVETAETLLFTAATVSNTVADTPAQVTGTILDDDIIVTEVGSGVTTNDPFAGPVTTGSTVTEGTPLLFTVTLNKAPSADSDVTLQFADQTATFGTDTTTPLQVSFDNGATFTNITGTTVTVPSGASSFIVSVPTVTGDGVETAETLLFTAATVSNTVADTPAQVTGTIVDGDTLLVTGLSGQYFGYNDANAAGKHEFSGENVYNPANLRHHQDDQLTSNANLGNLNSLADIEAIINGRNGSNIVGTSQAAGDNVADVQFKSTNLNYGIRNGALTETFSRDTDLTVTNNLGSNVVQAAGEVLDESSALAIFLGQDEDSGVVLEGAPVNNATSGQSSGIGLTTDSAIRLTGSIFLERGNYDFRVLADDGFRLNVADETLIEFDGNQSPTVREYENLYIDGAQSGLTSIELIYWEQGLNGVLRVEYKPAGSADGAYQIFSLDNLAMLAKDSGLVLADNQDLVNVGAAGNPNWVVRSGEIINSTTDAGETLVGGAAKDVITGGAGNDVLQGLDGADTLRGGAGNDVLQGGAGNDVLDGGAGDDVMDGGAGDDHYHIDSAGDLLNIIDLEGTDTVEFEQSFNPGAFTLSSELENVIIDGNQNINITGNASNNRIVGGSGSDVIDGSAGDDRILGGAGSDTLTGGLGNDVFEWNLSDLASVGIPEDHIVDFDFTGNGKVAPNPNNTGAVMRTDAIDLRDLLQGETSAINDANFENDIDVGSLLQYLNFEVTGTGSNASTVINVSSTGGFANGVLDQGAIDQKIVLDNVNLFDAASAGTDSVLLLKNLLANGSLIVD